MTPRGLLYFSTIVGYSYNYKIRTRGETDITRRFGRRIVGSSPTGCIKTAIYAKV